MLGKCIKHEIKDTWLVCTVCCGIMLAGSILSILVFGAMRSLENVDHGYAGSVIAMYTVGMVFAVIGTMFVTKYYFFYRYYNNLFTDQGYLMHTLPVKKSDLINSKLIVAVVWQYISRLLLLLCILFIVMSAASTLNDGIPAFIKGYSSFIRQVANAFRTIEIGDVPGLIMLIIIVLLYPVMEMCFMYLAVALGQQSNKNRFVVSILALVGLNFAKRVLVSGFSVAASMLDAYYAFTRAFTDMSSLFGEVSVLFSLMMMLIIGTAAVYALNLYIVNNKLNLE